MRLEKLSALGVVFGAIKTPRNMPEHVRTNSRGRMVTNQQRREIIAGLAFYGCRRPPGRHLLVAIFDGGDGMPGRGKGPSPARRGLLLATCLGRHRKTSMIFVVKIWRLLDSNDIRGLNPSDR
jgi:hypothetical protein